MSGCAKMSRNEKSFLNIYGPFLGFETSNEDQYINFKMTMFEQKTICLFIDMIIICTW